ncbi:MAG: response regulator [Candidatus Omnitrophica bacterium]|nr:response regulator [Candidatus Omnitrophota bacterium]
MRKILIIDDEDRIRDIYCRLFVQAGIVVRRAKNAVEATNMMIREDMDLILLDLKMSVVDGRTMFDVIREYNPSQKVIVSSVYPVEKQRELIPSAVDYYDKSEGPVKLLEKVVNTLI